MMGVNDWGEHIPYEATTTSKTILLFKSFRTYKLARLLWLHILAKAEETEFYKPSQDRRSFEKGQAYLPGIKLEEAHAESIPTEDALKKEIELNPKDDKAYTGLGWCYQHQGNFAQAEDAFKKAIELNPKNDNAYGAILVLYEETGRAGLAKEYAKKVNRLRLEYHKPVTVNNYRKLKEILAKRGIRLVCVQYPMCSVEPLEKIFEKDEGVIFVDNEATFKAMVKKSGFQAVFRDMFGGDFGHCTPKGNKLLAENIANVILKEVFGR
ncbi:MAG: tetratricopeptide repeat protein [Candidatus Omnitrophica bacterium]|nr:tetratricopeptide repeat protein [Candidatus Omnitrophota bacterium]